jgi:hypothetical protein
MQRSRSKSKPRKLGKNHRDPSDYCARDPEDLDDRSWEPGDKGQGREGLSKGYGGSGGQGTGASGPSRKGRA